MAQNRPQRILQILQIAHVTRSRHPRVCVIQHFALPRVRVVHAFASLVQFPIHAFASGTRARHCNFFYFVRSQEPCARVTFRWSSPQFLVFLPFLQASSPISKSFMSYKA
ncbi:uncharacterized protein DS421_15g507750 [Arachis hypogaea]|nr:uncharacterized protein DS421_15g507750 [Arachis hypogaea]